MAIVNGWVDWARVIPGVPDKVYSDPNKALGLIGHSIVGSWESAVRRFLSTARDPKTGRYTREAAASCMFIITFWGELIQMYPVTASPWTSGGWEANTGYWPLEMEGGAIGDESQPLSDLQVMATMRLAEEFEAYTGKEVVRGTTFREHGEIARELGYAATACPSGRYARFYEAWEEHVKLEEKVDFLFKILAAGAAPNFGDPIQRLQDLDMVNFRVVDSLEGLRREVEALKTEPAHDHGDLYAPKVHPHPELVPRGEALSGLITLD